jgi:hypothetical protein
MTPRHKQSSWKAIARDIHGDGTPQVMACGPTHSRVAHRQQLLQRLLPLLHGTTCKHQNAFRSLLRWQTLLPVCSKDLSRLGYAGRGDVVGGTKLWKRVCVLPRECVCVWGVVVGCPMAINPCTLSSTHAHTSTTTNLSQWGLLCPQAPPPAEQLHLGTRILHPPRQPRSAASTEWRQ